MGIDNFFQVLPQKLFAKLKLTYLKCSDMNTNWFEDIEIADPRKLSKATRRAGLPGSVVNRIFRE